jgi:hypothetical protein
MFLQIFFRLIESGRMKWEGLVAAMSKIINAYIILIGKSEGKLLLGRRRGRWENNIKMDLKETGWGACGLHSSGSG